MSRKEDNRRETWDETVSRYVRFFSQDQCPNILTDEEIFEIQDYIYNLRTMPSMRALMTAGPALARDNAAGFNCAFVAIDNPIAFDEIMYLLMCGVGVGFSVERQFIANLPKIAEEIHPSDTIIKIRDSKIGWAKGLKELIAMLYAGTEPTIDYSEIRPAGALLKTFGGRASGPDPLKDLYKYTINMFKKAAGRKLKSIECHDLCCKIGEIVVVGGVRRSALISLSNLSDLRMREAKSGQWWDAHPERALANNSVAYTEKPELEIFIEEWLSLIKSKSGERGIFNREAATFSCEKTGRRVTKISLPDGNDFHINFFINPCGEIILRSCQFCNLTEIVIRPDDTLDVLLKKAEIATKLASMQATLTNFRYLRQIWKKNTEEEALIGVSLTGIMDHPILSSLENKETIIEWLTAIKEKVIKTNKEMAKRLGINKAAATTTIKPSGTVSQLVNSSSGIHSRFAPYYIRTVRADNKDPITKFLKSVKVPNEPDEKSPNDVTVFSFPIKAPDNAVVTDHKSAIEQLEFWKLYKENWAEHNISITVYVKENEWLAVANWVWDNFDLICGITFLPYSNSIYNQAPYQEISKEKYEELVKDFPVFDFRDLSLFEKEDNVVSYKELSCTSGSCELVDIGKI